VATMQVAKRRTYDLGCGAIGFGSALVGCEHRPRCGEVRSGAEVYRELQATAGGRIWRGP
jgi:hypothetical protein